MSLPCSVFGRVQASSMTVGPTHASVAAFDTTAITERINVVETNASRVHDCLNLAENETPTIMFGPTTIASGGFTGAGNQGAVIPRTGLYEVIFEGKFERPIRGVSTMGVTINGVSNLNLSEVIWSMEDREGTRTVPACLSRHSRLSSGDVVSYFVSEGGSWRDTTFQVYYIGP